MSALDLLVELRDRGALVRAEGDRLLISPRRVIDSDLEARIRARKAEVLQLLRAAPPDLALADRGPSTGATLSARGREALGGKASQAPKGPLVAARPGERSAWLREFFEDGRIPLAEIDHGTLGRFILARDSKALEVLAEEHAPLPILSMGELLALAPHGVEAVRSVLETRRVFGPHVAFRGVYQRPLDG